MIQSLIDKQDTVELVRDQIAQILANESVSQQALATDQSKDPANWKFRVFRERFSPWEDWLNAEDPYFVTDSSPIINVWFDSESFDGMASNISERQKASALFNIDCYGYGVAQETDDGHLPGDRTATFEAQRCVRFVRNVLMASEYTYLSLRGLVWNRWPASITTLQMQLDNSSVQKVVCNRLSFRVEFNEFSPQYEGQDFEILAIDINDALDGQVMAQAQYDFTT